MKVTVIGGGPAGLYCALLLKKQDSAHEIVVLERNRPDDTFGWGVVFSDATLENLAAADLDTHQRITNHFAHWDDIDIHFRGRTITSGGHGFSGISRKQLLRILQERAAALGVDLHFQREVHVSELPTIARSADLVIAADGSNSMVRRAHTGQFRPDLDVRTARFIWLGTPLPLDAFTFIFIENEHGVYQAHAYRFDRELSTFIVECDECSWRNAGFDRLDADQTVAACERMFAPWLAGRPLMHNAGHQRNAPWQQFVRVRTEQWWHDNIVLVGDAAHTAHFSIGSGTKLALEDAIALARVLASGDALPAGLDRYQTERQTEALRLQNAARNSMEWFENVRRYVHLEPEQFAYSLLTRSQRVSHENLRLRDRDYLEGVERWFASRADARAQEAAPPPAFTPYRLRGLTLANRIVVAPMDMYSATDGVPNDLHLVHLGARALGGASLVFTEMVCVSPEGRISPGCTGMYDEAHVAGWQRIVRFVHEWSPAKICLQLGHAGRKGSTKKMWEGMDEPLDSGNWPVLGPSALPYGPNSQIPRELTKADLAEVRDQFVRAAQWAIACGFDMLELHCAHGYLLSSFITPLSNVRTDEYGGSLENRLRYPIEVFAAMRSVWPQERPMSVRISATDWADGGVTGADAVTIARAFIDAGADIIHVSTGQTSVSARPVYGRMFQTPFSDWIRNEARVPTIAVGNITEIDQVNSIIAAGRADLVALGRPHLSDPNWTLRAAAQLGWRQQAWPPQYLSGKQQLERVMERA
ncbi:MAG TPA: bifunctional salicylyl-CoA 5-hydroxylase/oxidoreductase, partial [Longimicrobiales bacterium]|nr:bifunctional salicylyl-CoA 5-hydroxylase/oxidoreductase [Longimicrobiales bacterium]